MDPTTPKRLPGNGYGSPARGSPAAMDPSARPGPLRPSQGTPRGVDLGRADRFEDEKRRISATCFSKLGDDGKPLQNYITHVRVEEDAMYPSSPPPPDADRKHKKERVIVVAVKNTGRVWLHKARENPDSSFQIGKSWPLEEMQAVSVYRPDDPSLTGEEGQQAQWGGELGFMIHLSKPYFWLANTAKEKEFFVGSVIKIYRKYTSGNMPRLTGFTQVQMDEILSPGIGAPPPSGQRTPQQRPPPLRDGSPSASRLGQPPQAGPLPVFAPGGGQGGPMPSSPGAPAPLRARAQSPAQIPPGQQREPSVDRYGRGQMPYRGGAPPPHGSGPGPIPMQSPPPGSLPNGGRLTPQSSYPALGDRGASPGGDPPSRVYQTPPDSLAARSATSLQSHGSEGPSGTPQPQPIPERRRPPMTEPGFVLPTGRPRGDTTGFAPPLASRGSNQDMRPGSTRSNDLPPASTNSTPQSSISSPPPIVERSAQRPPERSLESPQPIQPAPTAASADQQHRPGLGPMTGPRGGSETAAKFKKAATAAGAFKPRAGGAGARLLAMKKQEEEPAAPVAPSVSPPAPYVDVPPTVPIPSAEPPSAMSVADSIQQTPTDKEAEETAVRRPPSEPIPQLQMSRSQPDTSDSLEPINTMNVQTDAEPRNSVQAEIPESIGTVLKKNRSNKYEHALAAMGIDPEIFGSSRSEYENVLADFGWETSILHGKKVDALELDLRREVARLEAGSWLGTSDHKDERVEIVEKMLDKAIAECDEMEGLLTLYAVELGSLTDDVAYIEAQSHGLQVQTANQKALQSKLQDLVDTISIDPEHLEPLQRAPINDLRGLQAIEACLVDLYRALATIDPQSLSGKITNNTASTDENLANMRALRDRKQAYVTEVFQFLSRLRQGMDAVFSTAFSKAAEANNRTNGVGKSGTLDSTPHDAARSVLWRYSPLMLFAKEIDMSTWKGVMGVYLGRAHGLYFSEFKDNIASWKKAGRPATADEQQALFTAQEKESDSITSTAKKITVKRSQMLARGLMTGSFEKRAKPNKNPDAKYYPFESFGFALEDMLPLMTCEQNFIVDFFHTSTVENTDFVDAVLAVAPEDRRGTVLNMRKPADPDRSMANRILQAMDQVFGFWPNEIQTLVDWAISSNEIFTIGVLCAIERALLIVDPSQEYIIKTLQNVEQRLSQVFQRSVESQVRAIEDTKVKVKKRSGVIGFMKVFPNYVEIIESMLPQADLQEGDLEIRGKVDQAYNRINRAMFDSLKVIAKESPSSTAGYSGNSADPDDKEALNYHILLIENMHHYVHDVSEHGDPVLGEWRGRAMLEMAEHQNQYINAVIRRPLGKVLDFVESVESVRSSSNAADAAPQSIPTSHPSHSHGAFKKVMNNYTAKDIRKGVEALRARVEKHFAQGDEPSISQKLVVTILAECERRYADICDRSKVIANEVYQNTVEVEFSRTDISAAFRR